MVSQWETGTRPASVERVMDWSRLFRVPVAYFFGEIMLGPEDLAGDRSQVTGDGNGGKAGTVSGLETRPTRSVSSFDPDEVLPMGLEELIESGMVLTAAELRELRGYADPRDHTRGAHGGAWGWTWQQWLRVLSEDRLRKWKRMIEARQRRGQGTGTAEAGSG